MRKSTNSMQMSQSVLDWLNNVNFSLVGVLTKEELETSILVIGSALLWDDGRCSSVYKNLTMTQLSIP